ncbi:uncharacterized protein [Nicotiana tomentosiformis]|uniref:uncharacterized protein n=1 Tax=Nicotiana tomentosiformis TaxID=4098 RepID=UPI00388C92BC
MSVHPSERKSQSSVGRGRGRGRGSSSGSNQNHNYALAGQQDQESSPDVVTGMLTIFSHDAYALIDRGSTLSCITPFIMGKFGIVPEILSDLFAVPTPVGESIIARLVYRGCTVIVCGRQNSANLVELEMLDFDAIMGMDWLAACYATVDCRAKTARFHFPSEPVLEWVGNTATPRDAEIPTLQYIPVVKEYAGELPGVPSEREIDFGIDLLPGTQSISIPPYRMSVALLGHIVSDGGIKVDTQKIEAVKSWPRPTTMTEVRSILRLAGYYWRFI